MVVDVHVLDAPAVNERGARGASPRVKLLIELQPVDGHCFDPIGRVADRDAGGRVETSGLQRIQDHGSGEIELRERVVGQDAGAVHRVAARRVLLEYRDVEAAARQKGRGIQTARPAADDGYISHPDR